MIGASCAAGVLNFGVFISVDGGVVDNGVVMAAFSLLALAQLVFAVSAIVYAVKSLVAKQGGVGPLLLGLLASFGAASGWFVGLLTSSLAGMGGAWGRPLRIRGRQLHPNLREGTDWTRGDRPDGAGLDAPTREALGALWLHDAQKEHASVPAFSRISWMLAAVGAPAELMEGAHKAALEEIEHTRLCFALAAGYQGRSKSVEAMPDLLLGMDFGKDPLITLAIESLEDGCLLEDYNADVAAACAQECREPVTRSVLETIAIEERSHADYSWDVLAWVLEREPARVGAAVEKALTQLTGYPRPTAVSDDKRELLARADADALRAHGRLPDAVWAELWSVRQAETVLRVRALLERVRSGAQPGVSDSQGIRVGGQSAA